jgi:hypothetical protein
LEEALKIQLALEKELGSTPDGYVYEELAELYSARGANPESKKCVGLALAELPKDTWSLENEKKRVERRRALTSR